MRQESALRYMLDGSFCSFRDPAAAKYQTTFWFPPKTTVVGFLGCALGLESTELEPLYDQLRVGVTLVSWRGIARDLWGFTKLKGGGEPETAVLIREMIYQACYVFYVGCEQASELERIRDALLDPVYPLRLGRSEDLAIIRGKPESIELTPVQEIPWLRWTLLPYAIQDENCTLESFDTEPRPRIPPRPSRMPVRFHYRRSRVREAETAWTTQVFDWAVRPSTTEGLWTDGEHVFYLV
jgi:CRISPR-associated Cas5-like protein